MNNKDFKNLQNSLYNNILPPPESLKHSHGKGFDAHKPLNHTPDLSDSEHTQSSQTRSDERFRMTEKFPLSLGEGWGEGWHWQKALKTVALTLALSFFIVAPAMAQAPTPTLDNLHNQDITMPDSTEKYPESAYTLTEIENADPENLPENAITLYDKTEVTKYYDPSTGEEVAESDRQEGVEYKEVTTIETTPKYYTVSLKQTAYGDPNGTTTLIYVWEKNADTGNLEFKQDPTAPVGQTITYKYIIPDGTSLSRRENTTDNSSETITGVFLNQTSSQFGGAISNNGSSAKLGDINANFIGNYLSSNSHIYGGAIYNSSGTIGDIIGDFIGNYAVTSAAGLFVVANGGAIYNSGIIGDITGDFIGNYTYSNNYVSEGGAIYNDGTIGDITGNFIGNYAASSTDYIRHLHGGAIYNSNTIRNITGDFIGNYASTTDVSANGGAIYNAGTIGDITGDFIGNYASSTDGSAYGGAIYNDSGTIGDITGDFIGNYVSSNSSSANGGAIYNNSGTIGNITGDFINNYGAAINNRLGTIGNITGDFIDNYGAAINNNGTIGNITGDFIGNYKSSSSSHVSGGAISNNNGTIGDITGDFIGNYASTTWSSGSVDGGVIYNYYETIGDITGDFIDNYASSSSSSAYGGVICNYYGTIGNITGDFIGNYAVSSGTSSIADTRGGAIYNENGTIGTGTGSGIIGDFIGNYVESKETSPSSPYYTGGGAIANYAEYNYTASIGDIEGSFITNHVKSTADSANGGAIHNRTYALNSSYSPVAQIGNITGDFIGNYASGSSGGAYGGAISNSAYGSTSRATIGNITGNFIDNYAVSASGYYVQGGAIYNYANFSSAQATIEDITGNFIGNYVSLSYVFSRSAYGGAIYNSNGTIGNITGDFIGNYASSTRSSANGGAIYNSNGTITLTNSNFYNNYAKSESGTAQGGAIYASGGTININADNGQSIFSGNYVEDTNGKRNEAVYAASSSTNINLTAKNNGTIRFDDTINGASGYNLNITGDGTGTVALYNDVTNAKVTTGNVTVDVANNETRNYNFVSMTAGEDTKLNLDVNFANKTADTITTKNTSTGTLIINAINSLGTADGAVTIQIIKNTNSSSTLQLAFGDNITEVAPDFVFDKNYVEHTDKFIQEGGLSLATTDTVNDSITIDIDKQLDTLQLINSYETDEDRTFQFADSSKYMLSEDLKPTTSGVLNINGISASAPSTLDANSHTLFNLQNETNLNISNVSIEGAKDYAINAENKNATVNLTNTSFKNTDGTAINSNVDINITADGGKSEFTGNTTAIYMNDSSKTINMTAANQGEIVLSDVVDGAQGYSLNLDGDDKSKITVNNNVNNANISLDNTNLYLSKENYFDNAQSLSLNSGAMYLNNNAIGTMHIPTLNLNGTTNLSVDVDLANESMDRITADTYNVTKGALLNVTDLNLLSTTEKNSVKILFADEPLANNVEYTGDSPISYKGTNTVYSPIYKYDVQYGVDENDKLGYFFFNRAASGSGSNGNISDAYNPAVLASPVATQAGAYTSQLQTFNYAFQHADTFMNIPYLERISMINKNKYAMSPTGDATDVGTYSPLMIKQHDPGFWVKPYASFENIPLKNGPKVSNINYGTLVGYDSPLQSISNGFERVLTGYIGYNGASQRYSGVDAYQNGGLLGGTATFYKGNFFNATTLSVGASVGDASTMYGSENYTMLLAGLGNKTGYNFEFFNGGMILQPSMLISYTFVNTFDYNNAAGVRIESDPMHAIQLAPGIKLIGNTKNGWQPYIGVSMVWNLLDESKVTADSVRLPEMSIKPYVQYGVGLQKRVNDKFLAFGQAMIHNGGRNGVSLSAGLRWKIGRE